MIRSLFFLESLSLTSRFMLLSTFITLVCVAGLHYFLAWQWWLTALVAAAGLVLNLSLTYWLIKPVRQGLQALESGLLNFKDGEFSTLIGYQHHDELGKLCQLYNHTADKLRQEKQWIYQRELMLDKVLHNSPQALLLVNDNQHLVYSNQTARNLLFNGQHLEGKKLPELLQNLPTPFADALQAGQDGLFSLENQGEETQTWYLATGQFLLNNQYHHLYVLKQLTRELSRQEVAVWKKVIRVISHELNNSLAPISSMLHSGQILAGNLDEPRLGRVFNTIDERIAHLSEFVQGYGKFAKLPVPSPQAIEWQSLLESLQRQWQFKQVGTLPQQQGYADKTQLEQLLINLLKNAHESGSPVDEIAIEISQNDNGQYLYVTDGGKGMSEAVMANALVPFYSTKSAGSGLGLALCREITEAHHGHISLHNQPKGNQPQGGLKVSVFLPLPKKHNQETIKTTIKNPLQ